MDFWGDAKMIYRLTASIFIVTYVIIRDILFISIKYSYPNFRDILAPYRTCTIISTRFAASRSLVPNLSVLVLLFQQDL